MGIFDGVLICTDLDGTLFRNDKTVSEENKKAIEFFKREGGKFTFITGRMPFYAFDVYDLVKPNAPFGCINGGGLYDGATKKYIWTWEAPRSILELVGYIDDRFSNVGIQVNTFDNVYFCKENSVMVVFRRLTGAPNLVRRYEDVNEPIAKVVFGCATEEDLLNVEKTLMAHSRADEFDFIRSERSLFEILPRGIGKGTSIKKLSEYLGIDIRKTVAIGDYNNDISMFQAAGVGIAVANACPDALAAADHVTVSNEDHAIATVIWELAEGKYLM